MVNSVLNENQAKKRKILRASCIFIGIMLLLTFFSNTINNFSLPRVSTEHPLNGSLIKEVAGEGRVQSKESVTVYVDQGRLVDDVRGKVGDSVKKGQVIVVLNKEGLERQLKEEELLYDQMKLVFEKLTDDNPANSSQAVSLEAGIAKRNLDTAEENLENTKNLYNAGAVSREELKKAEDSLFAAQISMENEIKEQKNKLRDIDSQKITLQLQEMKIQELKRKVTDESTLTSPVDGIINGLNTVKGALTEGIVPVFSIADQSKGFEIKITVEDDKSKYLTIGDEVEISIKSLGDKTIKGKLREIADNAQQRGEKKDLLIDLLQEGLMGGETGEILIEKKTRVYHMLVSNTAIGTDSNGKFVWVLKERKGPLGEEFYVQRAGVTVDDSDSFKTAVLNGISPDENIVVHYSKNLSDGSQVIPDM